MTSASSSDRPSKLAPALRLLNSRPVIGSGMWLARALPPALGHTVANGVAGTIGLLRPDFYWTVYENLRHVLGPEADPERLHATTRRVFRHKSQNLYDLWHTVQQGREAVCQTINIPNALWEALKRNRTAGRGTFIAGTHTGNFDLGLLAIALDEREEVQVLGLAGESGAGFNMMNEMRRQMGARLTTIDSRALREALVRLREGGVVMTGVDRPTGGEKPTVPFFGQPALLPTGHVRLALKADASIIVASAYRGPEGNQHVEISPSLEMVHRSDPQKTLRVNMQRVTEWLEHFIRQRPGHWMMFVRVWPDQAEGRSSSEPGTSRRASR